MLDRVKNFLFVYVLGTIAVAIASCLFGGIYMVFFNNQYVTLEMIVFVMSFFLNIVVFITAIILAKK